MARSLFLFAWEVVWHVILGVCLMAGFWLAVFLVAAYLWLPSACDTDAGPKISDPLHPDIWARATEEDCSGFGAGSSRSRVEVGHGTSPGRTVFAQDSSAPDIRWSARGNLEIDVQTTEPIRLSEMLVDDIKLDYVIPQGLTRNRLERDPAGTQRAKIERFEAWSEKVHARVE